MFEVQLKSMKVKIFKISSFLLEKKIHRKENRILKDIYNGVRMFTSFSIRMSLSILRAIFQRDIIQVCCNIKSP